ncbi:MAG: hypothetical protein AAB469_00505 [Patescibacteria group bacterium]
MWIWLLVTLGVPLLLFMFKIGIVLAFAEIIIGISGNLINQAIYAQDFFLNPELLQTIWALIRDFINIFFILILLVIAFATIFNKPTEYTAKQLLSKLIIAALLINFSLVIGLWVIDILWTPAQIFYNPLSKIESDGQRTPIITEKLGQVLKIQEFFGIENLNPKDLIIEKMTPLGLGGVVNFVSSPIENSLTLIIKGFLIVLEAFIYAWIALILWVRIPVLLGLMLVSPIAWLGYTVPNIKKQTWSAWWQHLFCWAAIPMIIFGLIYFTILLGNQLSLKIENLKSTTQGSFLIKEVPYLGLETGTFMVWLITFGLLWGGMIYVRSLSCGLYGWAEKGLKKTWGWAGKTRDWAYTASGAKAPIEKVQKEFKEGGIPIAGRRFLGTAQREARETRIEDRLRAWAGLGPTFAAQKNLLDSAEKQTKDVENRIKQARNTDELKKITDELKETAKKGKTDPETLATINTLAKRGELDVDLFNQAVNNFKNMPLALSKVMTEWKEGKFGGITLDQFIEKMRDEEGKLSLDARRVMYSFAASDDGKKVAEKMEYEDFDKGIQIVGQHTKAGRDFTKFWGDSNPLYVAKYRFDNITDPIKSGYSQEDLQKIQSLQDAIREQMKKASVKNIGDYFPKTWDGSEDIDGIKMGERFEGALAAILREKQNRGTATQFVSELRRKLRREGKDKQLEVLNGVMRDIGMQAPEVIYQGEQTEL